MLQYLRRNKFKKKSDFKLEFFANPLHDWIVEDRYLKLSFEEFFDKCSLDFLNMAYKQEGELNFINQIDSRVALSYSGTIILSQEHIRELSSFNPFTAHGQLAYRIGVQYFLKENIVDKVEQQVRCDEFAANLGFAMELDSYIQTLDENIDKRVRLVYLSSYVLNRDSSF